MQDWRRLRVAGMVLAAILANVLPGSATPKVHTLGLGGFRRVPYSKTGDPAGAAAGDLPVAAVLSLPVLFAAGMTAMDTTDGILMSRAYDWAFINPLRKIFYNITTTGLSVAVALGIGSVELLQVCIGMLDLRGPFFDFVASLNFGALGYLIVGMFLLAWALSVAFWKFGRIEQRYSLQAESHAHAHTHAGGIEHFHDHLHGK